MGDVTILIGPPGSGKTRDILRRFVKCATHHGHDSVLLLLPTALVVARTRDALMRERRLPGLFDPRILTFPALAQAILDAGHQPIAPVSDVQRRLLVADVVRSLCEDHQLDALEAASDLPGFPDALCDVFDELKRAAVKPERLRAAVDALFPDDEHARALSVVYAAYQERLAKLNLFDEPGRFWWARDLLRDGKSDFLSGLRLVLVDGFSDFTTTQMQVLALVSGLADETVITLPMEKDQARAELFDAPRATLQSLKQHMPDLQECYLSASEPSGVISAVTRAVFATQPRDDLSNDDCAVRIIAAPGTRAEVEDVAREVKRLLLDGRAQPEDVAIVARRLDDYAQPLRDVFRDFGIPLHLSRPEPASRRPSVQVVLHLLATIAYDYRRSDVADFVRSNFVSLDALQPPKDRISPDDFDRIACEAGIIRGRENWTSHLQAYRKRLEEGLRPSSERDLDEAEDSTSASQARVERVDRSRKLFHALTKRLEPMRCEASRSKHVARLVSLIADFDIPGLLTHRDCLDDSAANVAAFGAFTDALADLADADIHFAGEQIEFAQFAAEVRELASCVEYPLPQRPDGAVLALEAHDARHLRFPVLFIIGLAEDVWPAARREGPFFDDDQRRRLADRGVPLRTAAERQAEEAFLFYLTIASASERLYLTYPTADADGDPILPSHYVDEVLNLFQENAVTVCRASLSDVIPSIERACCLREAAERAATDIFRVADEADPVAYNLLLHDAPCLARNVVRAARVERRRDSLQPLDEFDGVIPDDDVTERLRERFGPGHLFSAAQFASYGKCPFAFFLERVLCVEPLDEPTEEVGALDRGTIVHQILRRFFEKQQKECGTASLADADLEDCKKRMRDIIAHRFRAWEQKGLVPHSTLWKIVQDDVTRDLEVFLALEAEEVSPGWIPSFFEASYGRGDTPPLSLDDGDVKIAGKIDRVDVSAPEAEMAGYRVLDYKTGTSAPRCSEIEGGTDFQLPFYAMAAAQVLPDERVKRARCLQWAYYRVRRPPELASRPKSEDRLDELVELATKWALQHAENIRAGMFPVEPRGGCTYCDFACVCRYDPYRVGKKQSQAGGRGA